jgi:hypothetical protein
MAAFSYAEETPARLALFGKTHTIAAWNDISGPGSAVKNLANSYDMSIFEFNWGGRQSSFNGSGITTNANFPLTNGEALTNNTQLGLKTSLSDHLKAGASAEIYALIGDRTVGRVFGEELPWDNFPRESGAIQTPHFAPSFYNGFLEGKKDLWQWKMVAGVLSPKELPEFTRKEMNQMKLGSLVYRPPVTNASFFEKSDRKLEEGRHPLNGFDFIADCEYLEKKHAHLEFFAGETEPTPVSDIERSVYGGRASLDAGPANLGFTCVFNDGLRPTTGIGENQSVWALDSSLSSFEKFIPYFTFARTDYERENTGETHEGDAVVFGGLFKYPGGRELKIQYQRLEENYDLMAYHKAEHYPTNFQGFSAQGTIPWSDVLKIKGLVYYLRQIETSTDAEDTIFGDSFFPSVTDSARGVIGVQRLSADWKIFENFSLNGYVEHAQFRKETPTIANAIDKDVYNFFGGAKVTLTPRLYLEGGFRDFFSVGNWQAMNFRSFQTTAEAAVGYRVDKERRALLIYHAIHFDDHNGVSQGNNDYEVRQLLFEIRTTLG